MKRIARRLGGSCLVGLLALLVGWTAAHAAGPRPLPPTGTGTVGAVLARLTFNNATVGKPLTFWVDAVVAGRGAVWRKPAP